MLVVGQPELEQLFVEIPTLTILDIYEPARCMVNSDWLWSIITIHYGKPELEQQTRLTSLHYIPLIHCLCTSWWHCSVLI